MERWTLAIPKVAAEKHRFLWRPRNNGGQWWAASTKRHVGDILRAFREERVGLILYESVGLLAPTGKVFGGRKVILLQLKVPKGYDWAVDVCLSEIGVGLLDPAREENGIVYIEL